MRIQGQELRNKNRKKLNEVFPLHGPMLMYLEPTNLCNIRCAFCPTSDKPLLKSVGRPAGVMKWELFTKIVDDLKQFPHKLNMINFYKDGEPLVNKKFPEMVRHLRDANVTEKIWTKSNGLLLTPDIVDRLADCGLDQIGFSIIAPNPEGYKETADVVADYDHLRAMIAYLFSKPVRPKIAAAMTNVGYDDATLEKFYQDFEGITDYTIVNNLHGWSRTDLKDFALGHKADDYDGLPNKNKIVCPWPLYQMSVNWNGTVQPCNEDWSWVNILGDASKDSLLDIWNSPERREFLRMQLEGRRSESKACGTCWQVQSQIDDVDEYRLDMVERIR
mgnify:CR=1 FL=1